MFSLFIFVVVIYARKKVRGQNSLRVKVAPNLIRQWEPFDDLREILGNSIIVAVVVLAEYAMAQPLRDRTAYTRELPWLRKEYAIAHASLELFCVVVAHGILLLLVRFGYIVKSFSSCSFFSLSS